MTISLKSMVFVVAVALACAGCDRGVNSNSPPASAGRTSPPAEILPLREPPATGAKADVNPPGGGVHVDVPPNRGGEGVHVDVGPGGVDVSTGSAEK